jgi:hypothetical protein
MNAMETDDPAQLKLTEQTDNLIRAGWIYQPVLVLLGQAEERQVDKQLEYKEHRAEQVHQELLHQEVWTELVVVKAPALDRAVNVITAVTAAHHQRRHEVLRVVQIITAVQLEHMSLRHLHPLRHHHHHQVHRHNAEVRETAAAAVAAQETEVHAAVDKYLL